MTLWLGWVVAGVVALVGVLLGAWRGSRAKVARVKLEAERDTKARDAAVYREGQVAATERAESAEEAADANAKAHDRVVGALEQDAVGGDGAAVDRLLDLAGGVREDADGLRPDPDGSAKVPAPPAGAAPSVPVRGRR